PPSDLSAPRRTRRWRARTTSPAGVPPLADGLRGHRPSRPPGDDSSFHFFESHSDTPEDTAARDNASGRVAVGGHSPWGSCRHRRPPTDSVGITAVSAPMSRADGAAGGTVTYLPDE